MSSPSSSPSSRSFAETLHPATRLLLAAAVLVSLAAAGIATAAVANDVSAHASSRPAPR